MKKTISCLIALTIFFQLNNLNAQTKTQSATTYVGDQKNGQPDGMGVLTDTSGNVFKGNFKKGKKEGYGELTYKTVFDKDSTLVGYWKKDQFVGYYEYPFKIISKSYMISNASITAEPANPSGNIIEVTVESVSGGSATLSGEMPKPTLTEYIFNKGSFQEMFPRTNQQKRNVYLFQNVIFPIQAVFKFGGEDITVDFNEKKNYKLVVVLRN
ncbi:MAG: hypothetical protein LW603_04645 [Sediminibacterium sp.]|nr:hypothetical protein [Sediminibacterium sp.]